MSIPIRGYLTDNESIEIYKIQTHWKMNSSFTKLTLCKNFKLHNICPLGASCNFAHGEEEIRKVEQMMKDEYNNKFRLEIEDRVRKEMEEEFKGKLEREIELAIRKRKETKRMLKEEQERKVREEREAFKLARETARKQQLTFVGFLENIEEQNTFLSSPLDLSTLVKLIHDYTGDKDKWEKIIRHIKHCCRRLIANFLKIEPKDVNEESIKQIKSTLGEYIHPSDTTCFFNVLEVPLNTKDRMDVESGLVYLRRSMEMMQKFVNIRNTPKENRRVYLHVKAREKTVLCRNYNRSDGCKNPRCKFAHSIEEQRKHTLKLDEKMKEIKVGIIEVVSEEEINPVIGESILVDNDIGDEDEEPREAI